MAGHHGKVVVYPRKGKKNGQEGASSILPMERGAPQSRRGGRQRPTTHHHPETKQPRGASATEACRLSRQPHHHFPVHIYLLYVCVSLALNTKAPKAVWAAPAAPLGIA